jgi:hypothetical protein
MKNGIYIYGIIKTSEPQVFGEIGIGDETPSKVYNLVFKDIAAIISSSPLVIYDTLSREKVLKDLTTHQLVLEKVMQHFTIVPVKFGTMVETENEVTKFLEKGYDLLTNELDKAKGKIELDVVVWWDLEKILATIPDHNEQIQAKQQEIAMKGEQASLDDKVMLGHLIEQALKAEKARYQQLILQTLKQVTMDLSLHELVSDKMILDAAFLLEKKNEGSFDAAVHSLDQKLENMVNFRVVGPLPLYSFSTVVFEEFDAEKVEKAKKTLGLTGEITEEALRGAYYQLAREYHPDTKGDEGVEEFELIHNAYSTLESFLEKGLMHVEVRRWKEEIQ